LESQTVTEARFEGFGHRERLANQKDPSLTADPSQAGQALTALTLATYKSDAFLRTSPENNREQ
jgi:hypothetical protein